VREEGSGFPFFFAHFCTYLAAVISGHDMLTLTEATSEENVRAARQLFEEYAGWIEISLCFQNFDRELEGLPGDYAPPRGRLLLALADGQLAGCIALRPLAEQACEMKRLYVRPEFRGLGLGRMLTAAIIEAAKELGYQQMRLDTLPGKMDRALVMYRRLGFKEIEPYYPNPITGVSFMELAL
jgi:putative acetyltransferase